METKKEIRMETKKYRTPSVEWPRDGWGGGEGRGRAEEKNLEIFTHYESSKSEINLTTRVHRTEGDQLFRQEENTVARKTARSGFNPIYKRAKR